MGEEERLLTLDEAAARLGVSKTTINRRIKSGSLRAINIGGIKSATYRIREADIGEYVERDSPEGLTVDQVASRLSTSQYSVWRRIREGSLRANNIGTAEVPRYRVTEKALGEFLQDRSTGNAPEEEV